MRIRLHNRTVKSHGSRDSGRMTASIWPTSWSSQCIKHSRNRRYKSNYSLPVFTTIIQESKDPKNNIYSEDYLSGQSSTSHSPFQRTIMIAQNRNAHKAIEDAPHRSPQRAITNAPYNSFQSATAERSKKSTQGATTDSPNNGTQRATTNAPDKNTQRAIVAAQQRSAREKPPPPPPKKADKEVTSKSKTGRSEPIQFGFFAVAKHFR